MKKIKISISNFIFILFFLNDFFGKIFIKSPTVRNSLLVLIGIIAFLYTYFKKRNLLEKKSIELLLFFVLMLICLIYNRNGSIAQILWIPTFFGIAVLIYSFKISYKSIKFIYYTIIGYFLILIGQHIDPNKVFINSSRNGVSVFLIFHTTIYYIMLYREKKKLLIYPALLSFIICLWALGRAGIIVSFLMFVVIILENFRYNKKKILIEIGCLVLVGGYCILINKEIDIIMKSINRFNREQLESVREIINREYFFEMCKNILNFILGVPFSTNKYLNYFKNPHNSFIMLHSQYGLIGFFIVIFNIIKWIYIRIIKKKIFEMMIGLLVILRISLDWLAFPGIFDILFWYILLENSNYNIYTTEYKKRFKHEDKLYRKIIKNK